MPSQPGPSSSPTAARRSNIVPASPGQNQTTPGSGSPNRRKLIQQVVSHNINHYTGNSSSSSPGPTVSPGPGPQSQSVDEVQQQLYRNVIGSPMHGNTTVAHTNGAVPTVNYFNRQDSNNTSVPSRSISNLSSNVHSNHNANNNFGFNLSNNSKTNTTVSTMSSEHNNHLNFQLQSKSGLSQDQLDNYSNHDGPDNYDLESNNNINDLDDSEYPHTYLRRQRSLNERMGVPRLGPNSTTTANVQAYDYSQNFMGSDFCYPGTDNDFDGINEEKQSLMKRDQNSLNSYSNSYSYDENDNSYASVSSSNNVNFNGLSNSFDEKFNNRYTRRSEYDKIDSSTNLKAQSAATNAAANLSLKKSQNLLNQSQNDINLRKRKMILKKTRNSGTNVNGKNTKLVRSQDGLTQTESDDEYTDIKNSSPNFCIPQSGDYEHQMRHDPSNDNQLTRMQHIYSAWVALFNGPSSRNSDSESDHTSPDELDLAYHSYDINDLEDQKYATTYAHPISLKQRRDTKQMNIDRRYVNRHIDLYFCGCCSIIAILEAKLTRNGYYFDYREKPLYMILMIIGMVIVSVIFWLTLIHYAPVILGYMGFLNEIEKYKQNLNNVNFNQSDFQSLAPTSTTNIYKKNYLKGLITNNFLDDVNKKAKSASSEPSESYANTEESDSLDSGHPVSSTTHKTSRAVSHLGNDIDESIDNEDNDPYSEVDSENNIIDDPESDSAENGPLGDSDSYNNMDDGTPDIDEPLGVSDGNTIDLSESESHPNRQTIYPTREARRAQKEANNSLSKSDPSDSSAGNSDSAPPPSTSSSTPGPSTSSSSSTTSTKTSGPTHSAKVVHGNKGKGTLLQDV